MVANLSTLFTLKWEYWLYQTVAMCLTALFIPKLKITSIFGALFMVVAIAFVNSKLWDAALFLSIPDAFSLRALSLLLANGVIFWALVKLLPGIEVQGVLPALVAPLIFSATSLLISQYHDAVDWPKIFDYALALFNDVKGHFSAVSS